MMHNEPMIRQILAYFNLHGCNMLIHTIDKGFDIMNEVKGGSVFIDDAQFWKLVASLKLLSKTVQPEISYAVNYLA